MTASDSSTPAPANVSKSAAGHPWAWVFFILSVLLGAGLGLVIVRWGSGKTAASRQFSESNQFYVWQGLVAGLLATAVAVSALTTSHARRVAKEAGRAAVLPSAVGYLLICAAVIVGPIAMESGPASFELYDFRLRIALLSLLVLACGASCFCGLMMLGAEQRDRTRLAESGSIGSGEVVRALLKARADLQRFLTGAAVLITGAVLMIGGLQSALNADYNARLNNGQDTSFIVQISTTGLLLFGAFFAALLALIFIPAYLAWQTRASDLRDRLYPVPEDGRPPAVWYEGRTNMETLLEMRAGVVAKLLAAFGILAPFVGSIVSAVILPTSRGG